MTTELIVASSFAGYQRGQVITDPSTITAILSGPYSDQVRPVILTTGGGSGNNTISGVPSVVQVGAPITGTYTAAATGQYICLRINGADVLPRVALPGLSGSLPTLSASAAANGTVAMYAASTGGSALFETGSISFTVAAPVGYVLPPNASLIGTDPYGVPNAISVGSGLSLSSGALIATGGGGSSTIPPNAGGLLGGTGTVGIAAAVTVGAGLSLSNGTLSAAGGSSTITGVSIDGSTIVASTGSPYQMQTADRVVDVNKGAGAATKILLPTNPTLWVDYTIIDGKGDSGTNNITVAVGSGTINGASSFIISSNNAALSLRAVSATVWKIV